MTYESFKGVIVSSGNNVTNKDVKSFTIRYALLLFLSGFSMSISIQSIIGTTLTLGFLLLFLFLYVWSFDLIAENPSSFRVWNKVSKFWWLIVPIVLAISLFLRLNIL